MPMTPEERKKRLGHGGLTKVAKRTRRTLGHVSQVNAEKRSDPVVERAIARAIARKCPEVAPEDVWPTRGAAALESCELPHANAA